MPAPPVRHDMPASFGPSIVPDRTEVARAEALVLSAPISPAAAAALLPPHFTAPAKPVLAVSHMVYRDIDYLGGRSYNELVVTIGAAHEAGGERIEAGLGLVLWVNQPGALIAGREYMGLPKLLGTISDLQGAVAGTLRFTCAEYETAVVTGSADGFARLDEAKLERLNQRSQEVRTFGWKLIAGPGGGRDLDYPLLNVMRWRYDEAWTGSGAFTFQPTAFADAPMSAAAVRALAALPLAGPVRAFRGIGRATIDRTATRALAAAPAA